MFFSRKSWLASYAADHHLIKRRKKIWPKVAIVSVLILAILALALAPAIINGYGIYQNVASLDATAGEIMASVSEQDFPALESSLAAAQEDLSSIKDKARWLGPILLVPAVAKTARTGDQMLAAAIDLLSGYREMLGVFSSLSADTQEGSVAMNFSTPAGRQAVLQAIVDNRGRLEVAKTKIKNAKGELAAISTDDLNGIFKTKIIYANNLLAEVIGQSETALPLFRYLPELAGYGQEKKYLMLFQNNMELRPTGGFIGSYGVLTVKDGEIVSLATDDIYNLDKLSKDKLLVPAPWPMTTYNGQKYLFLRDANWSPDWPTAAREINWFWNEERKLAGLPPLKVDGIIAITPDFIANFLELTGPITADGITFDHENFTLQLEKAVEFDYVQKGIPLAQRKSIIGDLSKEIVSRLLASSPKDLLKVWMVIKKDIEEKNIITWLADAKIQQYISEENWTGEVRRTEGDYLYIVDANLAALKTDAVMERQVEYGVNIDDRGDLNGRAAIAYKHNGKIVPGLISKYRTYARVYVPSGSWFTRAYLQDDKGTVELSLTKDAVFVNELGRLNLGVFLTVEPGASKTLVVEYRLPENIKQSYKDGSYKLLVQKQPGTPGHKLKIDLRFDQPISAYSAASLPVKLNGKKLLFEGDLRLDREITVKF